LTEREGGAPSEARPRRRQQKHRDAPSLTDADTQPEPTAKPEQPIANGGVGHGAEIAHHTRGRVRLKINAAKQNPALLEQIKASFSNVPGIEYIDVRPSTGSVILFYDPDRHADVPSFFQSLGNQADSPVAQSLLHAAKHHPPSNKISDVTQEIEDEAEFLAEHSTFAKVVVQFAKEVDRYVKRATDNNIDLKIMVPITLAAFTFLEIGAAAATPMWVTLVIFSLNHFVELHAHDADKDEGQT
jgi:hypothetical protein